MKREAIAAACHAINAAYCAAIGDNSQPAWDEAPEWQKASALAGVDMHLANPDATPEQSHESWLAAKVADGWAWGEAKDPEKKLHPCVKPYAELPVEQKVKDYLFKATVATLKDLADVGELPPIPVAAAQLMATPGAMLPVRYIGHRPTYIDGAYGTRIKFEKGQTQAVPQAIALKMYQHKDVYEPGDPLEATAVQLPPSKDKAKENEAEEMQIQRDALARMSKTQLASYAKTHFRIDLDSKLKVEDLRAKVTQLVDQYGIGG